MVEIITVYTMSRAFEIDVANNIANGRLDVTETDAPSDLLKAVNYNIANGIAMTTPEDELVIIKANAVESMLYRRD